MMDTDMDYAGLAKAGSSLGTGAVIVLNETRCMVATLVKLSHFYSEESCGQCTPCREGVGWLYRIVRTIAEGSAREGDIEMLESVARSLQGATVCGLGQAATLPVLSFLSHFRDEFVRHMVGTGSRIAAENRT